MKFLSYAFIATGFMFAAVLYTLKFFVLDFQLLTQALTEKPYFIMLLLYAVLMLVFAKKISQVFFNMGIKNLKTRDINSVHQIYFSSFIIKNAMIESAYLFTFAISMLIHEATLFVITYAIGAMMIYKGIPTEASVKEDLRAHQL